MATPEIRTLSTRIRARLAFDKIIKIRTDDPELYKSYFQESFLSLLDVCMKYFKVSKSATRDAIFNNLPAEDLIIAVDSELNEASGIALTEAILTCFPDGAEISRRYFREQKTTQY